MKLSKVIYSIIFLVLSISLNASEANAHTELQEAIPANGAVLERMPESLSLTFGEELLTLGEENINQISLIDPTGNQVELADLTIEGPLVTATILRSLSYEPGKYSINYRIVSADGHPVKGELSFTLAPEAGVEVNQEVSVASTSTPANRINLALVILFLVLIVIPALIISVFLIARKQR